MLTPEETAQLAADEPTQQPGETAEQHTKRHSEWYGRMFAFHHQKTKQTEVPVITVHEKKAKEAA